jgi:hypothetical protein
MLYNQPLAKSIMVSQSSIDFEFWVILFKNMTVSHIIGSNSEFLYQQWFTTFIFYIFNHKNMIET